MIKTSLYRQKDPRWAYQKLGFSSYTIGNYGCAITSICNFLSAYGLVITPGELNKKLKEVNGFAPDRNRQKCLVLWQKVIDLFPSLLKTFWRAYNYDNQGVLTAIRSGVPVLVEVQLGGYRHWVLFVGDQKMVDPLRSILKRQEPTSKYPLLTGYCLLIRR